MNTEHNKTINVINPLSDGLIQIFTVIWQVVFASVIGVYHGYGFTVDFPANYLVTYCKNFIMALPLQLIVVGPLARFIFRCILSRERDGKERTIYKMKQMRRFIKP